MMTLVQDLPGWLGVLMAAVGALVSGLNLGRSRWAAALLGGFVAELIALVFFRVAALGIRSGALQASSVGVAFFVASLLGLMGRGTVIAGLAGMFSELGSMSKDTQSPTTS
jgi:hypothetical protein